ncbi:predicted protein [Chaetoceros tenuissimus]|uniref:C3H1-type domain-containing protein n=1 Tax=Chaetoceros tenuissimus TaxID=426638 RepID=A0AAD3CU59_9STRA|nr:predicted protein [Chaetoceros tenuissimus]
MATVESEGNEAATGSSVKEIHEIEGKNDESPSRKRKRDLMGSTNSDDCKPSSFDSRNDIEPVWYEISCDAEELESLLFCIRRTSAREKLFKFIENLKILSTKLKRHDEITNHLISQSASSKEILKRHSLLENENNQIQKQKKPRIFPLENKDVPGDSILSSLKSESSMPTSSLNAEAPLLKTKDDFVKNNNRGSKMHCPDFESTNQCPLGASCNLLHIYSPKDPAISVMKQGESVKPTYTKIDLENVYEKYRKVTLTKSNYSEKIKADQFSVPFYSCALKCPLDNTVYYSSPFPGDSYVKAIKSKQNIWWYSSMRDAKDVLATIVINDLKQRFIVPKTFVPRDWGDKSMQKISAKHNVNSTSAATVIPILPDIKPLYFMESNYGKRCTQFYSQEGCPFGPNCAYAHVHFPKSINNLSFPSKLALLAAYKKNFQVELMDRMFGHNVHQSESPFYVISAFDNLGAQWFTSAFQCPVEKTIFYAAGGQSGRLNNQNMFLYPTVEEAKLAVSGVVLNSFQERHLSGDWNATDFNLQCHAAVIHHPPTAQQHVQSQCQNNALSPNQRQPQQSCTQTHVVNQQIIHQAPITYQQTLENQKIPPPPPPKS